MSERTGELRIPPLRLAADVALSFFGIAMMLFILSAGPTNLIWLMIVLMLLLAALWFLWRTIGFARTRIEAAGDRLIWNGHTIAANQVEEIDLRFFGGLRHADKGGGEYQLTVKADGRMFRIDGRLDGFEKLLAWLARTSRLGNVTWSARTRSAFAQFGETDGHSDGDPEL